MKHFMKTKISPQTILITGASSGFGEATAHILAKQGNKLILLARRKDKLEKLAKNLETPTHIMAVDISDTESLKKSYSEIPEEFSHIDILINNAGLAKGVDLAPYALLENWEQMVDVNISGLIAITHLVLPRMRDRNSGLIINIGSVASHIAYKGANVYGATKAFVKQFSRNLRADLAETNIRISLIEPGMAETEFSEVRFNGDTAKAKSVYEGMEPLVAQDIAETVEWIVSRPERVNIDEILIMPRAQSYGGFNIVRTEKH